MAIVGALLLTFIASATAQNFSDINVDAASRQLLDFRERHKKPIGLLTTSAGKPVDIRETEAILSEMITNQFFIEYVKHMVRGRNPDRYIFGKGTGAYGYFEVTNDISMYTTAKVFNEIGKKTPLFARFSVALVNKGGSDTKSITLRGFSIKMYTEEGNLDFLNLQVPVLMVKDPIMFDPAVKAFSRNPKTNTFDFTQAADFCSLNPNALHSLLWLSSEFGLPRGFRKMNGFPIYTYEIYNNRGESFFVKFNFYAEPGFASLTLDEAADLNEIDMDFFSRDLYNSIENKNHPSWRVEMDVMTAKEIRAADFDPFDMTKLWPNGTYFTVPIGRVVLNKNVENQFAEVEQSAFNPANLVPGILGPHDQIFKGSVIAYTDAQFHRLGSNYNKVEINSPIYAKTYNRNGMPPLKDNGRNAPVYFPNSFNGALPYVDDNKPNKRVRVLKSNAVDLKPASEFYNNVLKTEEQKNRMIDNLALNMIRVSTKNVDRFVKLLRKTDQDLARRFLKSLERAKSNIIMPNIVEEIQRT